MVISWRRRSLGLGSDTDVDGDASAVKYCVGDDAAWSESLAVSEAFFSACGWVDCFGYRGDGSRDGIMASGCFGGCATSCVDAVHIEQFAATMTRGGFG